MSPKKTVILIVIAVAIVLFYTQDKKKVAEEKKVEEQKKEFVTVKSDDVMALSIERNGKTIAAERDGDGWKITKPVEWAGEKFAWDTIADNLTDAKIERTFPDEGEKVTDKELEDWGLKPAHLKLTATVRDGSKEMTFKFGNHPPGTKSSVYALSSEKENQAFIIPQAVVFSSSKELRDLRDRKMVHVKFDHDDLKQVEIHNKDMDVQAKVDGNGLWILTSLGNVRADPGQLRLFFDKLNGDAQDILDDVDPKKLTEYGLADDQLASATRYKVVMGSEGITKTFYIGKYSAEHQGYLGKREGKDSLFVIKKNTFKGVKTKVEDLRPKKAIPLETYNTDVISATSHGKPLYTLRKKDYKWRMQFPHDATAERDEVDKLIRTFNDHKITSYLSSASDDAALGLDDPQLVFKVEGKDKKETVLFGKKNGSGSVYCAWPGYPDRFLIKQEILDDLLKDPLKLLTPAEQERISPKKKEKKEKEEKVLDLTKDATSEAAGSETGTASSESVVPPKAVKPATGQISSSSAQEKGQEKAPEKASKAPETSKPTAEKANAVPGVSSATKAEQNETAGSAGKTEAKKGQEKVPSGDKGQKK